MTWMEVVGGGAVNLDCVCTGILNQDKVEI